MAKTYTNLWATTDNVSKQSNWLASSRGRQISGTDLHEKTFYGLVEVQKYEAMLDSWDAEFFLGITKRILCVFQTLQI
jgi:hypothetical protein